MTRTVFEQTELIVNGAVHHVNEISGMIEHAGRKRVQRMRGQSVLQVMANSKDVLHKWKGRFQMGLPRYVDSFLVHSLLIKLVGSAYPYPRDARGDGRRLVIRAKSQSGTKSCRFGTRMVFRPSAEEYEGKNVVVGLCLKRRRWRRDLIFVAAGTDAMRCSAKLVRACKKPYKESSALGKDALAYSMDMNQILGLLVGEDVAKEMFEEVGCGQL